MTFSKKIGLFCFITIILVFSYLSVLSIHAQELYTRKDTKLGAFVPDDLNVQPLSLSVNKQTALISESVFGTNTEEFMLTITPKISNETVTDITKSIVGYSPIIETAEVNSISSAQGAVNSDVVVEELEALTERPTNITAKETECFTPMVEKTSVEKEELNLLDVPVINTEVDSDLALPANFELVEFSDDAINALLAQYSYTMDDIIALAEIVHGEAGNQDVFGKIFVADVLLNRVDSDSFPDTPIEVVTQENQFCKSNSYTEEDLTVVLNELNHRVNTEILWFRTNHYHTYGVPAFRHGAHYFSA